MESVTFRMIKASIFALVLVLLVPLIGMAWSGNDLVNFRGGIAVDPESGTNVVCGVQPGAGPWTIKDLKAEVDTDGHIIVIGSGLLLASSNAFGSNGGQSVRAELFCNTTAASCGDAFSTSSLVALDADGDFRIDDTLSPTPPSACTNPVLLFPQAAGKWLAGGIPK